MKVGSDIQRNSIGSDAMRILYVVGTFPQLSETFVGNEIDVLTSLGHEVTVLSLHESSAIRDQSRAIRVVNVRDLRLGIARPALTNAMVPAGSVLRWAYSASVGLRMTQFARDERMEFDVVHAHFANMPTSVAAQIATSMNIPYTFMAHATDYRYRMSDKLLARKCVHANGVFVVSSHAVSEINERIARFVNRDKFPNFKVIRAASNVETKQRIVRSEVSRYSIVCVARLVEMKGLDVLIRSLPEVFDQLDRVATVELIGDGPLGSELRQLARDVGVSTRVTFHGATDHKVALQILAEADLAVLPARKTESGMADGIPVFLMEAASLGVPIVTTDLPGLDDLVQDGSTGRIVSQGDSQHLANAIVDALQNEPALSLEMANRMTDHYELEFNRYKQAERLLDVWEKKVPASETQEALVPVSVIVLTKNEEQILARCLSYLGWADECVVVDSDSSDQTVEIATSYGATVVRQSWLGWSAQRTVGAQAARNDWVLFIEADEVPSADLVDSIRKTLSAEPSAEDAFSVDRRNEFLGVMLPNSRRKSKTEKFIRLFNRTKSSYDPDMLVHEEVIVSGSVRLLKGTLIHWRQQSLRESAERIVSYAETEARMLNNDGRRAKITDLAFRPALRLIWLLVVAGEIRLGARGILHAGLRAFADFLRYALLWSEAQRSSGLHPPNYPVLRPEHVRRGDCSHTDRGV